MTTVGRSQNNFSLTLPESHPLAVLPVPCPLDKTFRNAKDILLYAKITDGIQSITLVKKKNEEKYELYAEKADGNTVVRHVKKINEETKEETVHSAIKVLKKTNYSTFHCVCGGELVLANWNKKKACTHCHKAINIQSKGYYRCNNGKASVHKFGFYLCFECGDCIKQVKKQYRRSIINYKTTNKIKSATHWVWCLVGGRYGSQENDAPKKKRFSDGMTQNLDLVEEHIRSNNLAKAQNGEPINNALYCRLFEPESLTKKEVLRHIDLLLMRCFQESYFGSNNLCGAVIYYTGHGRNSGNWVLKEGDISFEDIYDIIVNFKFLWQHLRLVFIIDCCYAGVWCKKLASMYDVYPSTKRIVMMASADENNTTRYNKNGAYFTRYVLGTDEKLPQDAPIPYYCWYEPKADVLANRKVVLKWKDRHVAQQKI